MGDNSGIEWTDASWNPVVGCSHVSAGCDNCYAEALARRYGWTPKPWTPENQNENVILKPERLEQPLKWKRPRMIFVNSMSDLFHPRVPGTYIEEVFSVMARAPQHVYQVLTKRPKRMRDWTRMYWHPGGEMPQVWLGTSVEDAAAEGRLDLLRETLAAVRFISAEPLIGAPSPELSLEGIDWVIIGGESGPRARPLDLNWVQSWIDVARRDGAAVFVKQLGAVWAREFAGGGKGGDPAVWPGWARLREWPAAALPPGKPDTLQLPV